MPHYGTTPDGDDVSTRKAYIAYESDETTPFESYLAYAVTENEFGWSTGDDDGDTMPNCVAGLTRKSEIGRAAFQLVDDAADLLDTMERLHSRRVGKRAAHRVRVGVWVTSN